MMFGKKLSKANFHFFRFLQQVVVVFLFSLSLSLSRSTTTIIVMAVSRFFVSFVFRVLCDFDEHKENARDY